MVILEIERGIYHGGRGLGLEIYGLLLIYWVINVHVGLSDTLKIFSLLQKRQWWFDPGSIHHYGWSR